MMDKEKFKAARSLYRYYLAKHGENRFTRMFNRMFGFNGGEYAFAETGCNYSYKFEWIQTKGSSRALRILERNVRNKVICLN